MPTQRCPHELDRGVGKETVFGKAAHAAALRSGSTAAATMAAMQFETLRRSTRARCSTAFTSCGGNLVET
jgi:hypothetical protein